MLLPAPPAISLPSKSSNLPAQTPSTPDVASPPPRAGPVLSWSHSAHTPPPPPNTWLCAPVPLVFLRVSRSHLPSALRPGLPSGLSLLLPKCPPAAGFPPHPGQGSARLSSPAASRRPLCLDASQGSLNPDPETAYPPERQPEALPRATATATASCHGRCISHTESVRGVAPGVWLCP